MQRTNTVLYVDDDIDDFSLISEAFAKYSDSLTVVHAGNGAKGIEILKQMNEKKTLPCLLIIDINMPILDGRQMLKEVKDVPDYAEIPVIMFSTSAAPNDRLFAADQKVEYVIKPVSFSELKELVQHFVNKFRLI